MKRIPLAGLLLIALLQLGILVGSYLIPTWDAIRPTIGSPAVERGAYSHFATQGDSPRESADSAAFVHFIRSRIGKGDVVIVPPNRYGGTFWERSFTQFFLYPSTVIQSDESCRPCKEHPEAAILAINGFPSRDNEFLGRSLDFFEGGGESYAGIYRSSGSGEIAEDVAQPQTLIASFLLDILLLASLWTLGWLLMRAFQPDINGLPRAGLALPIGAGSFTWVLFIVSWIGIKLNPVSVGLVLLGSLGGLLLAGSLRARPNLQQIPKGTNGPETKAEGNWLNIVAITALGGVFLAATILSAVRGYSSYDAAAIWAVKGYGIVLGESILAAGNSGFHGLAYPLNIPLSIGLFPLFGGDALPGSKLLFPLFGLSLAASLYYFLSRWGFSRTLASIMILLIFSVPVIFLHLTIGYANMAFATYLILGILWGLEGMLQRNSRLELLGGVLLGLASWTRAEGIGFSIALIAVLYLASRRSDRARMHLLLWIVPVAIIAGAWLLFAAPSVVNSQLGESVIVFKGDVESGDFGLSNFYRILSVFLRSTLDVETWGLIFPLSALLLILAIWQKRSVRKPQIASLLAAWLVLAAAPLGLFLVQTSSRQDLESFVGRHFYRAFIPAAILMVVLVAVLYVRGEEFSTSVPTSSQRGLDDSRS